MRREDAEQAAAAAFTRAGNRQGADPAAVDATLARYAERAERDLLAFNEAVNRQRVDALPYPVDAHRDILALVAAFRAAMGYSPTPTAREIGERRTAVQGEWRQAHAELPERRSPADDRATPSTARPWCTGIRTGTVARCGATNQHAPHEKGETPRWFDHD